MKKYRKLSTNEIELLKNHACTADSWDNIQVSDGFTPEHVHSVQFSGQIRIGAFRTSQTQIGGVEYHSGIRNARLHNVEIGDDCTIIDVHNYIANYKIGNNVTIENVNIIVTDGPSTFGNGVMVPVMNEGGGREIPIYDFLSSHIAYMLTLYRHEHEMIEAVERMISEYADLRRSPIGTIGNNVRIFNSGSIKNTFVGPYATLAGVSKTSNGSINSNEYAPVHLGSGVKCSDFIISSSADISDSTLISRCFIGQGCIMGKHYSALDSLFFANCQGFHGEATAIFAGPYTVSHHKSSLLIAGMFSFLNAGSGTNQSNHMYKLGPIHQGIVERGSKTTSNSYILWPAHVGAFTLVMGRHTRHSDTSDLPFSYLIENATESYLVPAVNLRSVGTIRDAQKWPKRDNRHDPHKLDSINFNLLSPYTVQKMCRGLETLKNIRNIAGANNAVYTYQNCSIRASSLVKGIDLYRIAITKFLGNSLISRITRDKAPIRNVEELRTRLAPSTTVGQGHWVDLSGMICPKSEVERLIADLKTGDMNINQAEQRIAEIHSNYYEYEWTWAYDCISNYMGRPLLEMTIDEMIQMIRNWQKAVTSLDRMLYEDAKKEFDINSKTGFGVDGDEQDRLADFEAVRGKFDDNSFVRNCLEHIQVKQKLGDDTIAMLLQVQQ